MERKKTVLLCVTGGIAAYKIATLASMLVKTGYDVKVVMTQNATNFINPLVFETLTQHKCLIDTFDRNFEYSVEHVTLAKWADIVMIAPATANVIGKLAHGIADDMLTTTVMACAECKKILAPALFEPAQTYLRIVGGACFLNALIPIFSSYLRVFGYTKHSLIGTVVGNAMISPAYFPTVESESKVRFL